MADTLSDFGMRYTLWIVALLVYSLDFTSFFLEKLPFLGLELLSLVSIAWSIKLPALTMLAKLSVDVAINLS